MKVCPACSREYSNEHDICRDDGVPLILLDTGSGSRSQNLIGTVVDGRYRLERVVGRGGMGTVYACRHVVVGKSFAMKVLRAGIERSEEILQRFIREAQAANAIRSRHICEMTDFGQLPGGAFYVVMELLDGISLTRALREKRLDRKQIKHVFRQIAETLDKAHRAGIVHRDLKPDNVMLVEDEGDPHFVKLVDFGIAKMTQSQASNLTETGVILGTPYYMSPEQARGEQLDHRSDIYALGVMMYRAFTGRLPFVADTAMGVLTRHLTEKPELPSRLADMDTALERLILRCLEKKPIDRFQSMADVVEALDSVADHRQRSRAATNPTVDERTGGLASPMAAKRLSSVPPPTRPEGAGHIPQAMPAPAVPSAMGHSSHPPHASGAMAPHSGQHPRAGHAQQMGMSGTHAMGASGGHAMASGEFAASGQHAGLQSGSQAVPGFVEPHVSSMHSGSHPPSMSSELPLHLQGEAATNRGVVSSRIDTRGGNKSGGRGKMAMAGGIAALAVVFVIAGVAVLSTSGSEPTPGAGSDPEVTPSTSDTSTGDESGEGGSDAATAAADDTAIEDGAGGAEATAPEPTATAETTATAEDDDRPPRPIPYQKRPPKPKAKPEPEDDTPPPATGDDIRSPFNDD